MARYDSDLVGVIESQMGVYEDKEIGDCFGEGEGVCKEGPGVGVRVEDDGQEGRRWFCSGDQLDALI